MRVLVISDLHLGDLSNSDDFGQYDNKLLNWISDKSADMIILAGDVYELWQHKMSKIRKAHSMLCKEFSKHKYVHVRGNHDYSLLGRMGRRVRLANGQTVWIEHGFRNDKKMTSPVVRFGVWLYGKTLEKLFPNLENFLAKKQKKSEILKNTLKLADKMGKRYPYVIMGHTHKADIEVRYSKGNTYTYYNSGNCQGGEFTGIIVDTDNSDIRLV